MICSESILCFLLRSLEFTSDKVHVSSSIKDVTEFLGSARYGRHCRLPTAEHVILNDDKVWHTRPLLNIWVYFSSYIDEKIDYTHCICRQLYKQMFNGVNGKIVNLKKNEIFVEISIKRGFLNYKASQTSLSGNWQWIIDLIVKFKVNLVRIFNSWTTHRVHFGNGHVVHNKFVNLRRHTAIRLPTDDCVSPPSRRLPPAHEQTTAGTTREIVSFRVAAVASDTLETGRTGSNLKLS